MAEQPESARLIGVMPDQYAFGLFRLNLVKRSLTRNGERVPLTSKAFDLLAMLAARPGQTVPKQAILDQVWAGLTIEENTLTRTVSMLRKALGESPGQHEYIVTVPGQGYRFVGAEPVPSPSNRRSSGMTIRVAALLCGIAAALAGVSAWVSKPEMSRDHAPQRLTSDGRVLKASISPGGDFVAYVSGTVGEEGVSLLHKPTGKISPLAGPEPIHYLGIVFHPRGNFLYAATKRPEDDRSSLWRISLASGKREKIFDDIESSVSFAPDGEHFTFIRPNRPEGEFALMIGNSAGETRKLASHPLPEWIDYPAWSPDGATIVCTLVDRSRSNVRLIAADAKTGRFRPIGSRTWRYVSFTEWTSANTLLFSAVDHDSQAYRLWELSLPAGKVRGLTDDLSFVEGASATRDGRLVVSVQRQILSAVAVIPKGSPALRRKITAETPAMPRAAWWGPNVLLEEIGPGRKSALWTLLPDGTRKRPFAEGIDAAEAAPCADGSVVFMGGPRESPGIWLLRAGETEPAQIVPGTGWSVPQCSPDSKWVVYTTAKNAKWATAWKAPLNGAEPVRLSEGRCEYPSISRDGKRVACLWSEDPAASWGTRTLAILPFEGGAPVQRFPLSQGVHFRSGIRWSATGDSVLYAAGKDGAQIVWRQPLSGGEPQPQNAVDASHIHDFQISANGDWLVSAGHKSSDVILLDLGAR